MNSNETKVDSGRSMDVLLKTIKELVIELHPGWSKTRKILPDSLLSRDLRLDSLARMELLSRIERSVGVILPEKIFIDAAREHILRHCGEPILPPTDFRYRFQMQMVI